MNHLENTNIMMIIIDAFRSDKFFEKNNSITPNLDSLIQNGTYFSNAISSADGTILSWSSIFTGKFPFKTGIRSAKFNRLSPNTDTFFNILKKKGYHFYSYLPQLSETIGLFPKFENDKNYYDFYMGLTNGLGQTVIDQLKKRLSEPWFFLVHSMDLHSPVNIDQKFDTAEYGENYYERKISEIDPWLDKISKNLDLSNTLLIITADHGSYIKSIIQDGKQIDTNIDTKSEILFSKIGEKIPKSLTPLKDKLFFLREKMDKQKKDKTLKDLELKPHEIRALMSGRADKDHFLFDEKIKVPLLLIGKNIPKGKKISQQVRTVDIFPTLFDLMGIKISEEIDGSSLVNIMNGNDDSEKIAYIESTPLVLTDSNDVIGIRTSKYKYFRDNTNPKNRVHLYDLENDPFEDNNLASTNLDKINKFENILLNIMKDFKNNDDIDDKLNSEEIENELHKLGYV
jgi:arylsulfatase A-like enzyme